VTAHRLDTARSGIEASLGASTYTLSNEAVENRPGGETTTLNRVLLQMPGVTQAGSGQVMVRGGGDLQYRLNNVILPEGLSDLGESLSPRMADKIELVTGALPAQYGLQVSGVVNITTKSGAYIEGGQLELYGGSHSEIQPAFEFADSFAQTNVFASGSYQHSNLGLASPDGRGDPSHGATDQLEGLAYVDHALDPHSRLSLIVGVTNEQFQIPNLQGLNAVSFSIAFGFVRPLQVAGISSFPSEALRESQKSANEFVLGSYLWSDSGLTLQASFFGRNSRSEFAPDETGDLLFFGSGSHILRRDAAVGVQIEGVYNLDRGHTLRAGLIASSDRARFSTRATVVTVDATGHQLSAAPLSLNSDLSETEDQMSAYVQDEWHPGANLTVNGGLRFDYVHEGGDQARVSPRLNAVFVQERVTYHVGYARYFVPAPADDSDQLAALLAGTSGRFASAIGTALKAETDNYYDAGLRWAGDDLSVGLDGYWRDARHVLDTGFFAGSPIPRPFNFHRGRTAGVELSATYSDGPLSAWANLALAETRATDIETHEYFFSPAQLTFAAGHTVPLSTDQIVTSTLGASYHWGPALLSGVIVYASGLRNRDIDTGFAGIHATGHVRADLSAVYHLAAFGDKPLDLRIDLINLFDSRYPIQDGFGPGASRPQWGPRREIFAGIEQAF